MQPSGRGLISLESSVSPTIPLSGEATLNSSGFFGGGQIGYNHQFQSFVVGIEADFAWSGIEGELGLTAAVPGIAATVNAGSQLNWFGTVRGRFGFLMTPSVLLYATGGWAFGETETFARASAGGVTASASFTNNKSGWTAGGGFEYALNHWATLKTEYLYIDLGRDNVTSFVLAGVPVSIDEKTTAHTIKAGFNVKLDPLWGRPY